MRAVVLATIAALTIATASVAQQETIGQHYRAYNAALQSGDLATAEREAAVALRMSEAQDAQGGHTAVLALNLATTRLALGHDADAIVPAREALRLAQSNPNAGVDPRLAALVASHAAFHSQDAATGDALNTALQAMRADDPWPGDIYSAAVALGEWQFAQHQYQDAVPTMRLAVATSAGSSDPMHAKANAQVALASTLIMQSASPRGLTATSGTEARTALVEAIIALQPGLRELEPNEAIPPAEHQYAIALAWLRILNGLISSQGVEGVSPNPRFPPFDLPRRSQTPLCKMSFRADPLPRYPPHQDFSGGVGAVALHWETDESGAFRRMEVIASVGSDFGDEVRAVMHQWKMVKLDGSLPGCTMSGWGIQSVSFDGWPDSTSRSGALLVHN